MLYHRVISALGQPECPLCHLRNEAVHRYLDDALYEQVNDPGLRHTLDLSRGFCREHAWALIRLGDSLAAAILYQDQVALAQEAIREVQRVGGPQRHGTGGARGGARRVWLVELLRRRRVAQVPCPACQIAREAEDRYVSTLLRHLDDADMVAAMNRSSFLCLPDLLITLDGAATVAQACRLLEIADAKLTALRGELGELIRKRDYRFQDEPRGHEQTSWVRAVGQLVGWPLADHQRGRTGSR